jgi:two-component sensor histidine kinase
MADWRKRSAWATAVAAIAALPILGLGFVIWRFARLENQARAALLDQTAALERALAASRLLHRELQHRTKNNLQLITSLLRLGAAKDPAQAMAAAIARIAAIGRAHADLQGPERADRAHSRNVIGDTVQALTTGMESDGVTVDMEIADCTIPVEKAAPLALIVNEALTNALKYGVRDGTPAHISVRATVAGSTLHVEIRDRGPGLPEFKPQRGSTGLRIIDGLANQIDATYELVNDGGAVFRLRVDIALSGEVAA